jgi:hypothetical protein
VTPAASGRRARAYGSFAVTAAAVSLLLAAAGWWPTRWLAGPEGTPAMLAGCAIGLVASLAGGLPVAFGGGAGGTRPGLPPAFRALAGVGLRLAVAAVLAAAAALSGRFAVAPLVAWTAVGYLVLLAVDTRFALAAARAEIGGGSDGRNREETRR